MIRTAIIMAALATPAHADRISIMLGSNHIGAPSGIFNEINPGFFYTKEGQQFDLTGGVYQNSYSELSVSLTASYAFLEWDGGEASVFGGMVYYGDDAKFVDASVGGWVPLAGLQVQQGNLWAQLIPVGDGVVDAVIAGGITFEVGQ